MTDDFFENIEVESLNPQQGKILISEPFLPDPHFKRTVVLLTEHNKEGTVGLVLNRSYKLKINDAIADFPKFSSELFYGGPVGQGNLFFIHRLGKMIEGSNKVMKGLYWGGDFDKLKLLIDTKQITQKDIRFFVGYSGWEPGQLDRELKEKSWIVANTNSRQVMEGRSKDFWKDILKGLGKKHAIMANFPEDPSLN